ncbi:hypothetical protein [Pseudomonas phage ZRG1]|nr:hypothetical protein [Pseudomonas phage ZRG1]
MLGRTVSASLYYVNSISRPFILKPAIHFLLYFIPNAYRNGPQQCDPLLEIYAALHHISVPGNSEQQVFPHETEQVLGHLIEPIGSGENAVEPLARPTLIRDPDRQVIIAPLYHRPSFTSRTSASISAADRIRR